MSRVPHVGFTVGGVENLALEASRVRAVGRARGIIPVPFTRHCVEGVIVREGRLVPVFDLSRVPAVWNRVPPPGGDQVIIVASSEIEAGILATGAETFIASTDPEPAGDIDVESPRGLRDAILSGFRYHGGRSYGLLNVEAALQAADVPAS